MRNYLVLAIALILVGCATPVERVASLIILTEHLLNSTAKPCQG